jgi:hypothetical protein
MQEVDSLARQTTVTVEGLELHLTVQMFSDLVWLCVTEDEPSVKPGAVLMGECSRSSLGAPLSAASSSLSSSPFVECDVLLGVRDDPLTLILGRSLTAMVTSLGETPHVLLALSVVRAGRALQTSEAKTRFLQQVVQNAKELLFGDDTGNDDW